MQHSLQGKPQEPGKGNNSASPCLSPSSFWLVSPGENLPAIYSGKQGVQDQALLYMPPKKAHVQIQKQTGKLLMHPWNTEQENKVLLLMETLLNNLHMWFFSP